MAKQMDQSARDMRRMRRVLSDAAIAAGATVGPTPGPFKAVRVFVNNAPDQWHVTTGQWGAPSIAVYDTEANARVGAAAPELIEALRAVLSMHCTQDGHYRDTIGAMAQARALLERLP